ncbi:hypothetical protein PROFUN_04291 [Planoprotostelium fungivorum]|uniref:Signal transducer and activator of transcription n=1 Tax=Planoprotostelium fungivorum TaxID=1890364 RepID=A0A2P6NV19_9EUKA|nr:hypothetical protein PROFUN_04291 [Planoprotostelium fungivorum]
MDNYGYGSPASSSSHIEDLEAEWITDVPDPTADIMAMIQMEGELFKNDYSGMMDHKSSSLNSSLGLSQPSPYDGNNNFDAFSGPMANLGQQRVMTPQQLTPQMSPVGNNLFNNSPMYAGTPVNMQSFQQHQQQTMQNAQNNQQQHKRRQEEAFSQPPPQASPAFGDSFYNPPAATTQSSQPTVPTRNAEVISELERVVDQVKKASEKLRQDQKMVPLPMSRENYSALEQEHMKIKNGIDWVEETHGKLLDGMLLESVEMHQLLALEQDLIYHKKQLTLYSTELQNFQKEGSIPVYGLHIIAQPFPDSVKQHKSIDEPLNVRMLSGAKFDTRPACTIRAEIIDSSNQKGPAQKKSTTSALVENGEKLINEAGVASFNDLKFPTGTRLKSIRIRFTARFNVSDLRGGIHSVSIESEPTNAIVVKTNENQWHEAEGILLKKTAFGNLNEITWFRFSNWLQRRYLGATKQNSQFPVRPLSTYDFQYIHALKFDNKPIITQKHFDNFWHWFGPLIHKIRYQRHVLALWTRGYICGFLTREEVESVLKNEQIGTFLIRVSERSDQFAVSYQSAESVKHYLVKNDDTHGAKRTLPDFLRDYKDFQCILQLSIDRQTNKRILRRCDKESVLKEFYSKKASTSSPGYEEVIQVQ